MAIKETIYLHRKHRVCIGNSGAQKMWNRYSFWTHASDVEFEDGSTLEGKISSMKGITNDINAGAGFAADVSLVKSIRDSLKGLIDNLSNFVNNINDRLGGLRFYEDSNGKWVVGADSVPKKLGSGLDGLKKIIVHNINVPITEQPEKTKVTYENNGNVVRYVINENASGSANYPYTQKNNYYTGANDNKYQKRWITDFEYDIKSIFPNDYQGLTAENFYLHITSSEIKCWHAPDNNVGSPKAFERSYDYNPINGILTVKGVTAGTSESWDNDHDPESTRSGNTGYQINGCELLIIS